MNRTAIPLLVFLAAAVSVPAQQTAPVPLFSADVIRTFTPPDNPITDAKAKLEEQARMPILNPVEMGQKDPKDVVAKLAAIPEFVDAFQKVFDRPPNLEDLGMALAAFERTRLSTEAPFDRFLHGDEKALNASQRRGWALFTGKARCGSCHTYDPALPLFGDNRFHNTGVAAGKQDFNQLAQRAAKSAAVGSISVGNKAEIDKLALETDYSDLGRFLVTQKREDIGGFRTPFLREVLLTGPYMHDGSLETLWDVVEFFNKGGERNPFLDAEMKPLGLTASEVEDLVNFLGALTSDRFAELRTAELDRQHTAYQYRVAVQRETHKGSR